MKTIYICLLLLSGCVATASKNDLYHGIALKPSVVEKDLGGNQKREVVFNPYGVAITATVDCDEENDSFVFKIKASSSISFVTTSEAEHTCNVENWIVE